MTYVNNIIYSKCHLYSFVNIALTVIGFLAQPDGPQN